MDRPNPFGQYTVTNSGSAGLMSSSGVIPNNQIQRTVFPASVLAAAAVDAGLAPAALPLNSASNTTQFFYGKNGQPQQQPHTSVGPSTSGPLLSAPLIPVSNAGFVQQQRVLGSEPLTRVTRTNQSSLVPVHPSLMQAFAHPQQPQMLLPQPPLIHPPQPPPPVQQQQHFPQSSASTPKDPTELILSKMLTPLWANIESSWSKCTSHLRTFAQSYAQTVQAHQSLLSSHTTLKSEYARLAKANGQLSVRVKEVEVELGELRVQHWNAMEGWRRAESVCSEIEARAGAAEAKVLALEQLLYQQQQQETQQSLEAKGEGSSSGNGSVNSRMLEGYLWTTVYPAIKKDVEDRLSGAFETVERERQLRQAAERDYKLLLEHTAKQVQSITAIRSAHEQEHHPVPLAANAPGSSQAVPISIPGTSSPEIISVDTRRAQFHPTPAQLSALTPGPSPHTNALLSLNLAVPHPAPTGSATNLSAQPYTTLAYPETTNPSQDFRDTSHPQAHNVQSSQSNHPATSVAAQQVHETQDTTPLTSPVDSSPHGMPIDITTATLHNLAPLLMPPSSPDEPNPSSRPLTSSSSPSSATTIDDIAQVEIRMGEANPLKRSRSQTDPIDLETKRLRPYSYGGRGGTVLDFWRAQGRGVKSSSPAPTPPAPPPASAAASSEGASRAISVPIARPPSPTSQPSGTGEYTGHILPSVPPIETSLSHERDGEEEEVVVKPEPEDEEDQLAGDDGRWSVRPGAQEQREDGAGGEVEGMQEGGTEEEGQVQMDVDVDVRRDAEDGELVGESPVTAQPPQPPVQPQPQPQPQQYDVQPASVTVRPAPRRKATMPFPFKKPSTALPSNASISLGAHTLSSFPPSNAPSPNDGPAQAPTTPNAPITLVPPITSPSPISPHSVTLLSHNVPLEKAMASNLAVPKESVASGPGEGLRAPREVGDSSAFQSNRTSLGVSTRPPTSQSASMDTRHNTRPVPERNQSSYQATGEERRVPQQSQTIVGTRPLSVSHPESRTSGDSYRPAQTQNDHYRPRSPPPTADPQRPPRRDDSRPPPQPQQRVQPSTVVKTAPQLGIAHLPLMYEEKNGKMICRACIQAMRQQPGQGRTLVRATSFETSASFPSMMEHYAEKHPVVQAEIMGLSRAEVVEARQRLFVPKKI